MAIYQENGFYLEYPDDWEPTVELQMGSDSVTFTHPQGSFWNLSRLLTWVNPEEMLAMMAQGLHDEYPQSDVVPAETQVGDAILYGIDVSFFYLDLPCTVQIRVYSTEMYSYILYTQMADLEEADLAPKFRSITKSWLENIEKEIKSSE
ncbi:MAG: hypothetical protein Q4D62_05755 [Planctomycetia bacterium]|nr:hypothetical protein [Planctomycetia bacterium]